jgi:hypothetical protein
MNKFNRNLKKKFYFRLNINIAFLSILILMCFFTIFNSKQSTLIFKTKSIRIKIFLKELYQDIDQNL